MSWTSLRSVTPTDPQTDRTPSNRSAPTSSPAAMHGRGQKHKFGTLAPCKAAQSMACWRKPDPCSSLNELHQVEGEAALTANPANQICGRDRTSVVIWRYLPPRPANFTIPIDSIIGGGLVAAGRVASPARSAQILAYADEDDRMNRRGFMALVGSFLDSVFPADFRTWKLERPRDAAADRGTRRHWTCG
jgi:hypothetical protein